MRGYIKMSRGGVLCYNMGVPDRVIVIPIPHVPLLHQSQVVEAYGEEWEDEWRKQYNIDETEELGYDVEYSVPMWYEVTLEGEFHMIRYP